MLVKSFDGGFPEIPDINHILPFSWSLIFTFFAERVDGLLQTGQRKGIKVTCFTDIFATLRHHSFNDYSLLDQSYKRMSCSFVELTTQSSLPGINEGVKYNPISFFAPFTSRSITSEINQKATLVAIVLLHCTRVCMANNGCCTRISIQCKSFG